MKAWGWLLVVVLAAPATASQKEKKEKPPAAQQAPSAEEMLAQAEQKQNAGDLDGAAELLRKAAALPGATGEPSLRLGWLLERKYELDTAMDAYKAAAEKLTGKSKGEALGRLAVVQELRGSLEAAATAEAAASADPEGIWPAIALSRAKARAGKGDEAVELAQKAASAGGGAAASSALGYAQEARGDMAAAEAAYRAAMAAEEGKVGAGVGLARVLRKTGRAAEAEPILQKVLADAPGAVEAYKESARVKMALNRPAEAMGDAATAAAMAEGDPEAQALVHQVTVAKALAYLTTNQVDLAISDLTKLRDQNPNMAEARVGLAKALIAKRQADAAVTELKKAIELQPDSAEAHFQMGYVMHVLKRDAAGALPHYDKAASADPGNLEYRTNLGAVLTEVKQADRAVAELTKVTGTPGYNRPEAWIYLGGAHLAAKRYKEAIAALQKADSIAADNQQTHAYLAWAYFGLKDAANFKRHGAKARSLGHKEPTLLSYLSRVEAGEPIK